MRLSELFTEDDIVTDFAPADKWDAISKLVAHLTQRGRLAAADQPRVLEAVISREKSMSTGMERGLAIPHAPIEGLEHALASLGLVSNVAGLPFESIDGRPTRIVVLLLIPRAQKLLHIRTLADIARVLGRESVREALLAASTSKDAWSALAEGDAGRR